MAVDTLVLISCASYIRMASPFLLMPTPNAGPPAPLLPSPQAPLPASALQLGAPLSSTTPLAVAVAEVAELPGWLGALGFGGQKAPAAGERRVVAGQWVLVRNPHGRCCSALACICARRSAETHARLHVFS